MKEERFAEIADQFSSLRVALVGDLANGRTVRSLCYLLAKYESVKEQMLVMDDYDGGMMHMAELIITDLKKLKKLLLAAVFWGVAFSSQNF